MMLWSVGSVVGTDSSAFLFGDGEFFLFDTVNVSPCLREENSSFGAVMRTSMIKMAMVSLHEAMA
jgi:hypothetical protein